MPDNLVRNKVALTPITSLKYYHTMNTNATEQGYSSSSSTSENEVPVVPPLFRLKSPEFEKQFQILLKLTRNNNTYGVSLQYGVLALWKLGLQSLLAPVYDFTHFHTHFLSSSHRARPMLCPQILVGTLRRRWECFSELPW